MNIKEKSTIVQTFKNVPTTLSSNGTNNNHYLYRKSEAIGKIKTINVILG